MYPHDIAVVSSKFLAKSAGILSVTKTLFSDRGFPTFFLGEDDSLEERLKDFRTVIFSGYDATFAEQIGRAHV